MKKIIILALLITISTTAVWAGDMYSVRDLRKMNIEANSPIRKVDFENAKKIMLNVHQKTAEGVQNGKGPFYAEIYDDNGNLVVSSSNSVVEDKCALYHAEVNTLRKAYEKYRQYDLSSKNFSIYVNAEPCIMCAGAIMWSGIKTIYFGVPSKDVERITGFDEGYKPNWIKEFKKRGITVYGNIEKAAGEKVLEDYVNGGHEIYKPTRDEHKKIIGMPNPWTDCGDDFKCGKNVSGFDFPLSLSNYSIRAMKGMFEITYPLDETRNVRVRKSFDESNNGDNSGDYNKYSNNGIYTLKNGVDINIRGDKDKIYVMYFIAESGVYSARCEQGMSKTEVEGVFDVIREAEEPRGIE